MPLSRGRILVLSMLFVVGVLGLPNPAKAATTGCGRVRLSVIGTQTMRCYFEFAGTPATVYGAFVSPGPLFAGDVQIILSTVAGGRTLARCSTGTLIALACADAGLARNVARGELLQCWMDFHANPGTRISALARCSSGTPL